FESYQEGTLLYTGPKEGEAVPVDAIIAVLGEEGEDFEALLKENNEGDSSAEKTAETPSNSSKSDESSGSDVTADDLGVTVITMPLLSDTMTEGVIATWNFKVGDDIKSDDAIADVETDKATMEVTAYAEGTLLHIGLQEGEAAKVNDIIAIVGPKGTDITPLLNQKQSAPAGDSAKKEAKAADAGTTPQESQEQSVETSDSDSRVKASPLARKL